MSDDDGVMDEQTAEKLEDGAATDEGEPQAAARPADGR